MLCCSYYYAIMYVTAYALYIAQFRYRMIENGTLYMYICMYVLSVCFYI